MARVSKSTLPSGGLRVKSGAIGGAWQRVTGGRVPGSSTALREWKIIGVGPDIPFLKRARHYNHGRVRSHLDYTEDKKWGKEVFYRWTRKGNERSGYWVSKCSFQELKMDLNAILTVIGMNQNVRFVDSWGRVFYKPKAALLWRYLESPYTNIGGGFVYSEKMKLALGPRQSLRKYYPPERR